MKRGHSPQSRPELRREPRPDPLRPRAGEHDIVPALRHRADQAARNGGRGNDAHRDQEAEAGARPAQDDRKHAAADSRRPRSRIAEADALRNAPGAITPTRTVPEGRRQAVNPQSGTANQAVRASGAPLERGPKGAGGTTESPQNLMPQKNRFPLANAPLRIDFPDSMYYVSESWEGA